MALSINLSVIAFGLIFVVPFISGAPVDVNNDDRPILDEISPYEERAIAEKHQNSNLEVEGIPSKTLSIYDRSQKKYADILNTNAKPIVDTIQEHEKYGNDGDRFYGTGRAIVNTFEGLANLINKAIETPQQVAKSLSRSVNEKLNSFGAIIVGL